MRERRSSQLKLVVWSCRRRKVREEEKESEGNLVKLLEDDVGKRFFLKKKKNLNFKNGANIILGLKNGFFF